MTSIIRRVLDYLSGLLAVAKDNVKRLGMQRQRAKKAQTKLVSISFRLDSVAF
jgi:hypothetical protein